ncbi:MAG: hypothetical protein J6W09_11155 [Bacteroidales bacterium]|nr:hypothetical protein [Bacteroidales bacterium]
MTNKEKYLNLMHRYWDAETTTEEERELAGYVARVDDQEFDELRGVLGYLSVGKEKKVRKAGIIRFLPLVAAASIVVVVAIGLGLRSRWSKAGDELYVCYSYGEKSTDSQQVMSTVESSLADFFGDTSPAEANLFGMFER